MKFRAIHYTMDISIEENVENENSEKEWILDSDIQRELGYRGSFLPLNNEILYFDFNPSTYNTIRIKAGEVKQVNDEGRILNMLFLKNIGGNSVNIGFNGLTGGFPIKLEKNEVINFRGANTYLMNMVLAQSDLGTELLFLFTSDSELKVVIDNNVNMNTLTDSQDREIVGFL